MACSLGQPDLTRRTCRHSRFSRRPANPAGRAEEPSPGPRVVQPRCPARPAGRERSNRFGETMNANPSSRAESPSRASIRPSSSAAPSHTAMSPTPAAFPPSSPPSAPALCTATNCSPCSTGYAAARTGCSGASPPPPPRRHPPTLRRHLGLLGRARRPVGRLRIQPRRSVTQMPDRLGPARRGRRLFRRHRGLRRQHRRSHNRQHLAGRDQHECFGISRIVLAGDRGMLTTAGLREDLAPASLDWRHVKRHGSQRLAVESETSDRSNRHPPAPLKAEVHNDTLNQLGWDSERPDAT